VSITEPATVTAQALHDQFDLVVLSCKAYDLGDAINSFTPAVGEDTAILPPLNGMGHLDILANHFGAERVLGGQCLISAVRDHEGSIVAKKPRQPVPQPESPTPEQAGKIVAASWEQDSDWGTLVWLVMVTGVRRAELLALRWSDVSLEAVEYQLTELRGHALIDLLDGTGLGAEPTNEHTAETTPADTNQGPGRRPDDDNPRRRRVARRRDRDTLPRRGLPG
jgi:hypothetical protein